MFLYFFLNSPFLSKDLSQPAVLVCDFKNKFRQLKPTAADNSCDLQSKIPLSSRDMGVHVGFFGTGDAVK